MSLFKAERYSYGKILLEYYIAANSYEEAKKKLWEKYEFKASLFKWSLVGQLIQ